MTSKRLYLNCIESNNSEMFLWPRRKRFLSCLEYERTRSDSMLLSPDKSWFISLGQTVDELKDERAARILMWHEHYKSYVVHMDIIYHKDKHELFIGDVVSKVENKGHGSDVLKFAIKLA